MPKMPPLWLSVIPLLTLVSLISIAVALFGEDALSGASQLVLLISSAVCVALGLAGRYLTFKDFEDAIVEKVSSVSTALVILLLIGALAGTWMVSGIVPTMIYYGINILHPSWFLVCACIISAVVSIMTGSSWTTVATIGIALMGIGEALGFDEGWVAGAIISGAYFGDKMSPLSDTTIMASTTVGTPLFRHIRYMMGTTIPTLIISLLVFTVKGLVQGADGESGVTEIRQGLDNTFCISGWLLIVPLCTGIMIVRKMPTLAILFLGVVMACVAAVLVQPTLLYSIGDCGEGQSVRSIAKGIMQTMSGDTNLHTGVEMLDKLVATHGMAGMTSTVWLIICAMIFGASMTASRMLECVVMSILRHAKSPASMVGATVMTGICMNLITCDQYLSIIISSSMYKDAYRRNGYEPRLLSRSVEDSATVTSPIIPWNTCGMTQASVLGVSTMTYLPYCIFNWLSPVCSVIVALSGKGIRRLKTQTAPTT